MNGGDTKRDYAKLCVLKWLSAENLSETNDSEEAEALGEPPEDPLLLFSVLHGVWLANYVAFDGNVMRELAAQLLGLAEKQGATIARGLSSLVRQKW